MQVWPRPFAFEHGDLLAESDNLQSSVASRPQKNAERTQYGRGRSGP
jgi:hypothetical protein